MRLDESSYKSFITAGERRKLQPDLHLCVCVHFVSCIYTRLCVCVLICVCVCVSYSMFHTA